VDAPTTTSLPVQWYPCSTHRHSPPGNYRKSVTVEVLLSLAAGLLLGCATGCAMGLSRKAKTLLYFPASLFKSVPVSVFLPVFMIIFHLDYYIYPMLCIPVWAMVAVNIANSISDMPLERTLQRRLLGLPLRDYLRDIVFWETLDTLFATIRIAAPFCLTLQVALDYFLNANRGLGAFIRARYESASYRPMYVAILFVCAFGFAMLSATDELSQRLQKWKTRKLN
jgi:sulfonate transport system permease protein